MTTQPIGTPERRHGLDALRGIALLLAPWYASPTKLQTGSTPRPHDKPNSTRYTASPQLTLYTRFGDNSSCSEASRY